jgi:hypothetical protein
MGFTKVFSNKKIQIDDGSSVELCSFKNLSRYTFLPLGTFDRLVQT